MARRSTAQHAAQHQVTMKAWLGVPGLRDLPRDQPRKRTMAATCAATGRQRTHFRERTPSQFAYTLGRLSRLRFVWSTVSVFVSAPAI